MTAVPDKSGESGIVLLTTLLVLLLISAMMIGFYAAVNSDVRAGAIDRDQTQAYAAAHAGMEKLTSALAQLFEADVSPTSAQILGLAATPPVIAGFEFRAPGGAAGSGYNLVFNKTDANGNPAPEDPDGSNITTGAYTGLKGIITKYPITITARSITGHAEVRLRRELQTVAVPVFQFGIFSDSDLSAFAGRDFGFGGRVHTNGNLFICHQTNSGTSTYTDRITAVGEVVRKHWSNGLLNASSNPSCRNDVMIPTSASTNRNLEQSPNEGSVAGMPGSTPNPDWTTISEGIYKGYIRTWMTGATRLDLPLVSQNATPVDLIRRPGVNSNENTTAPAVFGQRYFAQASLRILLSDRITDISTLPTVTAPVPILLDGNWIATPPFAGYVVDATHPPIALSPGPMIFTSGNNSSRTIKVTALPAAFLIPCSPSGTCAAGTSLTIGGSNVFCDSKTATTFFGCTLPGTVAPGTNVTAVLASGVTVSTTTSGSSIPAGPGSGRTVTLNTPSGGIPAFTTAPFSVNTFFADGKVNTCTGYDNAPNPKEFTDCSGPGQPVPNNADVSSSALASQNTGTIGGYIKIEKQNAAGVWTDVTTEILQLGIGDRNVGDGGQPGIGAQCPDPTPNAIIRIQRLRDNRGDNCPYAGSMNPWDWWPNTLYDPREGPLRETSSSDPMMMGGIMQYVALDVGNLKKWFAGTTGTTGTVALNNNGYIVYFSDRRGNHDPGGAVANAETGEYGFEDQVNPASSAGTPDSILQTGEDMNGNGTQQAYGKIPVEIGGNFNGAAAPYDATVSNSAGTTGSSPWRTMNAADKGQAQVNKVVLFRRALKIVNGGISGGVNNLPADGLTIATENPAYVQGNYNATTSIANDDPNVAAAIIADAVTLLSNNWADYNSFDNPHRAGNRRAEETGWRFGAVAGKGLSFPHCGGACGDPGDLYGTDGGAANFLRLLEDWDGAGGLNYLGSIVSLHISRQATGIYKFPAAHVYNGGERNFNFDIRFLTPSLLPPGTPMFRDINTLTFRQILRTTQ